MMKPQVTITLGRSGQIVVRDSTGRSDGGRANASMPSGSKRSMSESFGSGADRSLSKNKRMREDMSGRSYGSSSHIDDSRLGPKDLRRKLTRKRISRRRELENEERKKIELHEKVSRAIRSLESPDPNFSRGIASSREAPESPSLRSTYPSWITNGATTTSPENIWRSSGGISTPRIAIDELQRVSSMRPMEASRTDRVLMSNPLESSRQKLPMLPPAIGGMSRSAYQDTQPAPAPAQPVTVSGLLQSLGLSKYSINFKAEEIDMVALKQMGDIDLKELGIPMGPRKKILLALQARAKRPVTQPQINYMQ